GVQTAVVLFGRADSTKGDARTNFELVKERAEKAGKSGANLTFVECDSASVWNDQAKTIDDHDVIVDALFGTGLSRPLEGLFGEVVQRLNKIRSQRDRASSSRPWIFSVDLPSGLN